jgi:hypothetical protein
MDLLPINTTQQLADIFTKALEPKAFQDMLSKLGVHSIYFPACGRVLEDNIT